MSKIREEGSYQGSVISSGVGLTKNEYPQFIVELQAEEIYVIDKTGGEWIFCDEPYETIVAYLVLVDRNGAMTKNAEQVQKALSWTGRSFAELNDADYSDTKIQFQVMPNEYPPGIFKMQVSWISEYGADPSRSITKLDKTALKNLNSKYGAALRNFGKKAPIKPAASAKSVLPAKKKTSKKTVYTAESVWENFNDHNLDKSEDDLCIIWEKCDEVFDIETDNRTSEDWKNFAEVLAAE